MEPQKQPLLPVAALLSTSVLLAGLMECFAAFVYGTKIPYDSQFVPLLALGLVAVSVLTFVVALVAVIMHKGWAAITALLIATLGIVVAIFGLLCMFAVMLANHPI